MAAVAAQRVMTLNLVGLCIIVPEGVDMNQTQLKSVLYFACSHIAHDFVQNLKFQQKKKINIAAL